MHSHQLIYWIVFNLFVLAMLALDLGVLNRRAHVIKFREAIGWSLMWITLAALFAVGVYFWRGRAIALEFTTGYVVELALSVDNLFVFILIFRYFSVPRHHQHKVLFWGIIGALVMRGVFIAAGITLINYFHWIIYAFGAFLVYVGIRLAFQQEDESVHPEHNLAVKLLRKFMPVTKEYVGGNFFTRDKHSVWGRGCAPSLRDKGSVRGRSVWGRVCDPSLFATPLFVVLIVVETTDILFAVDSIPAILAITRDAFIVYTSNVFAIMGLRAMYFALAGMMEMFHYLHYGLSLVLVFIGAKMLLSNYYPIPTEWALGVVAVLLGISVAASLLFPAKKKAEVDVVE
jgi:tellurite resistance protein TerC